MHPRPHPTKQQAGHPDLIINYGCTHPVFILESSKEHCANHRATSDYDLAPTRGLSIGIEYKDRINMSIVV